MSSVWRLTGSRKAIAADLASRPVVWQYRSRRTEMPDVTTFNTLTFDCYGTLIDWECGILAELRPWVDRHGRRDLDDNTLLETFGTIEAACEAETPAKLYPEILAEVHRRLADKWNIKAGPDEAAEFGQSVGRWPAFADSAASLQYLKRHYKLVILSNVDRASFARSNEKLGVAFDRILTAQDIGSYKPSLRNFEYALGEARQHVLEIAPVGLVRTNILRGIDGIEFHAQTPVAAGEAEAIDVGEDHQLVVALEVLQRRRTVGEGGPTADRLAELGRLAGGGRDAPLVGQAAMRLGQDLGIELAGCLGLARGFDRAEALQQGVVVEIAAAMAVDPRAQLGKDAALPVDQGAVAIEGERAEPGDVGHEGSPAGALPD